MITWGYSYSLVHNRSRLSRSFPSLGCFEESVSVIKSLLEIHDLHDTFPEVAVGKNSSAADDSVLDSEVADPEQDGVYCF